MIIALHTCKWIDPFGLWYSELLRLLNGGHDQGGPHVDRHVGIHEFGVRETYRAVALTRGSYLLGSHVCLNPRVGISQTDIVEPRPQFGDSLQVLANGLSSSKADAIVVHRVDLDRSLDAFCYFKLVVFGLLLRTDDSIVTTWSVSLP